MENCYWVKSVAVFLLSLHNEAFQMRKKKRERKI